MRRRRRAREKGNFCQPQSKGMIEAGAGDGESLGLSGRWSGVLGGSGSVDIVEVINCGLILIDD